jgi:hypothetical protein
MQLEDIDEVDEDKDDKPQKHNKSLLVLITVFLIMFGLCNLIGTGWVSTGPVWMCKNAVEVILYELLAIGIAVQLTLGFAYICALIGGLFLFMGWMK